MTVDEMSAEEHMLVICEDPFFRLSYIVDFDYKYQTSLSHRCSTPGPFSWSWRWSLFNECQECGIDIPYDLMRTWRMFLMLDEVEIDDDFVRNVYKPHTLEERDILYWRKLRFL